MSHKDIKSILNMDKMVFDKIEFNRLGLKNDEKLKMEMATNIGKSEKGDRYRVSLTLKGEKQREYNFAITLTGFFSFDSDTPVDTTAQDVLIGKNAVAILLPYMRSELSLLTAQPDVDIVTLPIFNVNHMLDNEK